MGRTNTRPQYYLTPPRSKTLELEESFSSQHTSSSSPDGKLVGEENSAELGASRLPRSPVSDPALKRTPRDIGGESAADSVTGSGQDHPLSIKESYEGQKLFPGVSTAQRQQATREHREPVKKTLTMFEWLAQVGPKRYLEELEEEARVFYPKSLCATPYGDRKKAEREAREAQAASQTASQLKKVISRKRKSPEEYTPRPASTRHKPKASAAAAVVIGQDDVAPSIQTAAKRAKVERKEPAADLASVKFQKPRAEREKSAAASSERPKNQRGYANAKVKKTGAADDFCKLVKGYLTSLAKDQNLENNHSNYKLFSDAVLPSPGMLVNTKISKKEPPPHPSTSMICEFQDPEKAMAKRLTNFGDKTGLQPAEAQLAENMGISYDQYRVQKNRIFLGFELYTMKSKLMERDPTFNKTFNRTRTQNLVDQDVNKASSFFENFNAWGWFDSSKSKFTDQHFEKIWTKFMTTGFGKEAEERFPSTNKLGPSSLF